MQKKIAIVLGTRPEAIKLIPVYLELKKRGIPVRLVSTGQHQAMLQQIFGFFDVVPDVSLSVMVHNQTLSGLTARLTEALQSHFEKEEYDIVVVQGDTTTAMVASLVGFYNRKKIAHVEAGLRTYNKFSPFPEEVNRQIVGRIADFHFAPTEAAKNTLLDEKAANVYVTGNTVVDSLLLCISKVQENEDYYKKRFQELEKFDKLILITGHRRENFGQGFDEICKAIKSLSMSFPSVLFYYPVHLNPNVKTKVFEILSGLTNVYLDEPLPYDQLVYLMKKSYIILTDSGGIQEEAPSFNVPVLVMRDTTERPEGIAKGCSRLVGTNSDSIISAFNELINDKAVYEKMASTGNPYGDGKASRRIANLLLGQPD